MVGGKGGNLFEPILFNGKLVSFILEIEKFTFNKFLWFEILI